MRRHLSLIAATWLIFQIGVSAMSPFTSSCLAASQAAVDDDDCCKGMAPGQMCPLHHHRHSAGPALRCGCGSIDPALISLTFGLGVLPSPVSVDVKLVSIPVASPPVARISQARSLDPPPPRS